jgi:ABC-2 type transport system permease protein
MKKVWTLLKTDCCNILGLNTLRYSKDSKAKRRSITLMIAYAAVLIMLVAYPLLLANGLRAMNVHDLIPEYFLCITSLIIFFFSFFQAGGYLFQTKNFDMIVSLPLKPGVILFSRFLRLYLGYFGMTVLVMVPSSILYGRWTAKGGSYYAMLFISCILIPLIPMALASLFGSLIHAWTVRLKHRTLFSTVANLLLMVVILGMSWGPSFFANRISLDQVMNFSDTMSQQILRYYPPAALFNSALVNGNAVSYLLFAVLSILLFLLFFAVASWKYMYICQNMQVHEASGNYKFKGLKTNSIGKALYLKELKYYFSCPIYIMNTIVGYLFIIVATVVVLIMGDPSRAMELPFSILDYVPFVMVFLCCMSSTTASSISLEGAHWWLPLSLPVSTRDIMKSKLLVNMTLAVPTIVLCNIALQIRFGFVWYEFLLNMIIPVVCCFYISVLGLVMNCRYPLFEWKSEVVPVKQGGATMLTMLIGSLSLAPFVGVVALCSALLPGLVLFMEVMMTGILGVAGAALFYYLSWMDLKRL